MSVVTHAPERGRGVSLPVLIALTALPVVLFYAILALLNSNLPIEDDYDGLFFFALRWHALPDLLHRLPLLIFFQHNEYRMPLVFSLLGSELELTHHISLPLWTWTGNLLVLVLMVPLWRSCSPGSPLRERLLVFLPVVWMMMSLGYAETVDFALCGMQFVLVSALVVWTLYCISREDAATNYLACVLAVLACATYVNAFMMAPAGLFLLWRGRHWKRLVAWVAAFAVGLFPYVYHYQFAKHERPGMGQTLLFLLTVLGGPFGFHRIYVGAITCGISVLLLFGYLVWKRADRVAPFAFWLTCWAVLGFFLITFGRASFGLTGAIVSRYKIWSDLMLVGLYLQLLALWQRGDFPRLQRRVVLPAVITCAVLFGLGSDALGWYRLHWRRVDARYGMARYVQSNGAISPSIYPTYSPDFNSRPSIEEFAREKLTGVIREGLYQLPPLQ